MICEQAMAKLNLTMEVLDRRPDGYHNIRSVMVFVDLCDWVKVEKAESFSFWCGQPDLNTPDNLCVRAWEAMARAYPGSVGPAAIRLEKRIPCQSGMGGGSADCAAVLRALNRLFGLGLSPGALRDIGSPLGADVPACLLGGGLLAEGIGERITPVPAGLLHFVVVKPEVSFSTPRMYARLDQSTAPRRPGDHAAMLEALARGDAQAAAGLLMNHFEACCEAPEEIARAKAALLGQGALGASMTGAGSAVFGLFPGEARAAEACKALAAAGFCAFLCHSLPEAPEKPMLRGRGGKENTVCLD